MAGLDDYTPKHLRSIEEAKSCRFLGMRLTQGEVEELKLIGCRTCNNQIPAFHCKLPGAKKFNNGPYTRIGGDCTSCASFSRDLQTVALVAEITAPVG